MPRFVVRVWMPDRPGALGAVASRIGAVRGDLVGIDILETGGGRAIDELVVNLPDPVLTGLLVSEIAQVDGVDVEDVRPATDAVADPRLDALETAAALVEQTDAQSLLTVLVEGGVRDFHADWAAVTGPGGDGAVVTSGPAPPAAWLGAFLAGSRAVSPDLCHATGPEDVAWAVMDGAGMAIVVGREGRPFRERERRQLSALARIVDLRLAEVSAGRR